MRLGRHFQTVKSMGVSFHLSQCVQRTVQSEGLQNLYAFDPQVNLEARMVLSLAMVPRNYAVDVFDELATAICSKLLPVLDYFEDVFIGRSTARGRPDALFSVELWNCHETAVQGNPKTTNLVEAWHQGFQAHVQCSHPTLWRFLEVLKREDSLQLHQLGKLEMGHRFKKAKKYAKAAVHFQTLARDYDCNQAGRFFRGVARNVAF